MRVSQLLLTSEWDLIMGQTLLLSCYVHAILSFNYRNGQNHCSITWSGLNAVYNVIYLGSVKLMLHRGEEIMWHRSSLNPVATFLQLSSAPPHKNTRFHFSFSLKWNETALDNKTTKHPKMFSLSTQDALASSASE